MGKALLKSKWPEANSRLTVLTLLSFERVVIWPARRTLFYTVYLPFVSLLPPDTKQALLEKCQVTPNILLKLKLSLPALSSQYTVI